MRYFADDAEVYRSLGGVFTAADDHPAASPRPRGSAPAATAAVVLKEPGIQVLAGGSDVRMSTPADIGDRFWRGEHNAASLAKGGVKTRVSKALEPLPPAKPLFRLHKELVAAKDTP